MSTSLNRRERHMIHELRVLHCLPGRLPALLKRFETDTLRLFEKHGIKQLGFWTVVIGESNNDLFLILQWESLADRERKFEAFLKDPEWHEARRKREKDGPLKRQLPTRSSCRPHFRWSVRTMNDHTKQMQPGVNFSCGRI